ncbi:hypothetical protein [Virgisporangium aurantiacum]|uniref:Uncharacterized protein n=1 Tax=Virgisporangium aurantiacum TaxID=175570 RepID=A0A8J3ZIM6_9ACTN|nr:hypothetical protein [Virgisporangium aurantiacum]GIJ62078.1 hypothetical protein Vau01_095940 [Virgisporangium aurantiacum]
MNTHARSRAAEVRPIAEHALARAERRLTAADRRAGEPRRPALAAQTTSAGDVRVHPDTHRRRAVCAYPWPWPTVETAAVV